LQIAPPGRKTAARRPACRRIVCVLFYILFTFLHKAQLARKGSILFSVAKSSFRLEIPDHSRKTAASGDFGGWRFENGFF